MKIELIFDGDCPNVEATRQAIRSACLRAELNPKWQEWDRSSAEAPDYVRRFGSPTILVDGNDVDGYTEAAPTHCCRLYGIWKGPAQGVPSVDSIAKALRSSCI